MSNKYTYWVPFTEENLYEDYVNNQMTMKEIAEKYHTTEKVVWRAMRKMGIKPRKACKRAGQAMEQNANWKGGRVLRPTVTPIGHRFLHKQRKQGYWMVRIPSHPHANRNGYVLEHIVVALEAAGRDMLNSNECVHHINFDKHDNRPENLCICDLEVHRWYHGNLENLVAAMMSKGLVGFDPEKGYFVMEGGGRYQ